MITRDEIERMSDTLGVHPSHVQRDYVHGWILSTLYSGIGLSRQLVLKGGNCLRKGYFETARYSRDLDFSSESLIGHETLGRELNVLCEALQERAGVSFDIARTRITDKKTADTEKKVAEVRLYFHDFYGQESELVLAVRVDVTQFDRRYLPVQERFLVHPYSDSAACTTTIRCVKLEEILATKLRCLLQRKHIADLFDLAYALIINKILEIDRSELLRTFFRITVFGNSPGVAKGLFVDLPLEASRRFWNEYISCPIDGRVEFDSAKEALLGLVDVLIPGPTIRGRSSILFASSLRNLIIEAADTFTLLRLSYDGVVRLIEPYEIAFKQRRDGLAREYLYAYDRTGGMSSGPGLKTFVPDKVALLENTDAKFEPRFEVEIRKAGGAETASRFESKGTASVFTHRVQCPYCGKTFSRTHYSTKLNAHKDRYGNRCPGRVGYAT